MTSAPGLTPYGRHSRAAAFHSARYNTASRLIGSTLQIDTVFSLAAIYSGRYDQAVEQVPITTDTCPNLASGFEMPNPACAFAQQPTTRCTLHKSSERTLA